MHNFADMMRKNFFIFLIACGVCVFHTVEALANRVSEARIIATTDVHGCYFPYDFIQNRPTGGSLARVETYLKGQRRLYGNRLVYVDLGDILQGQPCAYYYNIHPETRHLAADILNYMGCSIGLLGNHEIETGTKVFGRYVSEVGFPVLGANILNDSTNDNYLPPYKIVEADGIRIAFLGMTTPAIPSWLPKMLWESVHFTDMKQCAQQWVTYLRQHEHPDAIIGLFHSGESGGIVTADYAENQTEEIAREVVGFDAIIYGHDHRLNCRLVANSAGKEVVIINPANQARSVASLTLRKENGKVVATAETVSMKDLAADSAFISTFAPQMETVKGYVSKRIGTFAAPADSRDALQGPSAFVDLVHQLQLSLTGADVSITAPLSLSARIDSGDVCVRDMFKLYRYENMLYTILLTGKEIKDHLEMSYDMWINHQGATYNYDSAAGIIYDVHTTQPKGSRIEIKSMADGSPFSPDKQYKVAINSYRGNGGGELLTKGAGIAKQDLPKRIIASTDRDLRYYLMDYIERTKTITPRALNQWRFVD